MNSVPDWPVNLISINACLDTAMKNKEFRLIFVPKRARASFLPMIILLIPSSNCIEHKIQKKYSIVHDSTIGALQSVNESFDKSTFDLWIHSDLEFQKQCKKYLKIIPKIQHSQK